MTREPKWKRRKRPATRHRDPPDRRKKPATRGAWLNARRIAGMRYQGDAATCLTAAVMADAVKAEILAFFTKGRVPLNVQKLALEWLTDEVADLIAQESLGWVESGAPWHPGDRNRLDE